MESKLTFLFLYIPIFTKTLLKNSYQACLHFLFFFFSIEEKKQ